MAAEKPTPEVFLSFAHADGDLAESLRKELEAGGVTVTTDRQASALGEPWQTAVEQAIRAAQAVLLLIHPRGTPDPAQDFEWRAALESVWENPVQRLIPVLLYDAELPTFVRSSQPVGDIQAIRLRHPDDLRGASKAILAALAAESTDFVESYSSRSEEVSRERRERLSEIREYAEQLK